MLLRNLKEGLARKTGNILGNFWKEEFVLERGSSLRWRREGLRQWSLVSGIEYSEGGVEP